MPNWRLIWVLAGWCLVLLVVYLSLSPGPPPLGIQVWDKASHTLAYLLLMYWFAQLYERRLLVAVAVLALGGGLEIAQGYTGYREASGLDMMANALGIAAGTLLAWWLPNPLHRLQARRA